MIAIPWRPTAAFAVAALVASCAPGDPGVSAEPFAQFIHDVQTARYADYAGRPGVAVRDEQAFEQMRQYLLGRYLDARVVSSYTSAGAVFDCMPQTAAVGAPTPPPPPGSTSPRTAAAPAGAPPGTAAPARQEHGCPAGTIAVRRVTLTQLVRFATLRSFMSKAPGDVGIPPPPPP